MSKQKILKSEDKNKIIKYLVNSKDNDDDKYLVYKSKRNILYSSDIEYYVLPLLIKEIILDYEDENIGLISKLIYLINKFNIYNERQLDKIIKSSNVTINNINELYFNTGDIKFIEGYFENIKINLGDAYKIKEYKNILSKEKYKYFILKFFKEEDVNLDFIINEPIIKKIDLLTIDLPPEKNYEIIHKKFYNENSLEILIDNIIKSNNATLIFKLLVEDGFNNVPKYKNKLKLALYKTKNIEYIAYYTFYNDFKMFEKIFISTYAFLSFIIIKEKLFEDKVRLQLMINDIKQSKIKNNISKGIIKVKSKVINKK